MWRSAPRGKIQTRRSHRPCDLGPCTLAHEARAAESSAMHPRLFAKTQPDHPAVIMDATGEAISYAQLEARANQAAHLFRAAGLEVGDSIAIFMKNEAAYFEVAW